MLDKNIAKQSLTYAAGAVLYVVAVATLMRNAERVFPDDRSVLGPITLLLLLVVSAATMGMLVFGKPVMLYIDGKKREGVMMAVCTIVCLALFAVLTLATAALLRP